MKNHIIAALAISGFATFLQAELSVSGSIFKMDELDKAKEKAMASKEPLIFVYTDPNTN